MRNSIASTLGLAAAVALDPNAAEARRKTPQPEATETTKQSDLDDVRARFGGGVHFVLGDLKLTFDANHESGVPDSGTGEAGFDLKLAKFVALGAAVEVVKHHGEPTHVGVGPKLRLGTEKTNLTVETLFATRKDDTVITPLQKFAVDFNHDFRAPVFMNAGVRGQYHTDHDTTCIEGGIGGRFWEVELGDRNIATVRVAATAEQCFDTNYDERNATVLGGKLIITLPVAGALSNEDSDE